MKIPLNYKKNLAEIKNVLKDPRNKTFFITGHTKPDGDAIGSMLALYSLLKRLGKNAFIYSYDTIPSFLKFLTYSNKINIVKKIEKKFDVAVYFECADISRFGISMNINEQTKKTINIDHHILKTNWADINWFDHYSSSVSELVYFIFRYLKVPLTKIEAECLYVGIVTDTRNFTQANTNSRSHMIAAELLECGVDSATVEKYIYGTKSLNALKLTGIALDNMKTEESGRIAYTTITLDDYKKTNSTVEDTEGIINYVGMLPDIKVWMIFRELNEKNFIKVGFRSIKEIDVNKISNKFGGGGHRNASGCTVKGNINEAIKIILKEVKKAISK
ncbi:MAG: hypothetical protein A2474_03305 [Elusimicrobia bacterium RIFOXYC2_FULL_34_12]|nr:MAG: hypothetical protein A2474_03305 [Elusimicrobia bacterium RIFOXYC2_FULL_34_12]OGS37896.1 MAG: hypothetical protein A2551_01630 [Elusimicrobia bacterium RIFOXYD2_FULL_34_30]